MSELSSATPTVALLGSTGKTGRVILRLLLASGLYNLKVYARSKERVATMFPGIMSNPRVQLFIGSAENVETMQECLRDARIIICTLGGNEFGPDTILRDSANSIMAALDSLRQRSRTWRRPRMVYLSSSTKNERFAAARPKIVHWLIETAFQNGYDDLQAAHDVILADPSLVSVLLVQPGVLVEEKGSGHEISVESVRLGCSYEDLGTAFVELALDDGYEKLDRVGVSSREGDAFLRYAPIIVSRISTGLFVCYFPGGEMIREALQRIFPWIS
ncbi:hypothetical protein Hte_009883 [Hypoxylon texense]